MSADQRYAATVWWIGCHLPASWRVNFILMARGVSVLRKRLRVTRGAKP